MWLIEKYDKVQGFAVFELLDEHQVPAGFTDLELNGTIGGRWVHIEAFSTEKNYSQDDEEALMLLQTIEERVKALNINILCVPLTYPAAIGFWERNGNSNVGTINWVADKEEKIACQFYKKSLSENVE